MLSARTGTRPPYRSPRSSIWPATRDLVVDTAVRLVQRSGRWLVVWSPATIDPSLTVVPISPSRRPGPLAPILGADGVAAHGAGSDGGRRARGQLREGPGLAHRRARGRRRTLTSGGRGTGGGEGAPELVRAGLTITQARYVELKPMIYPLAGTVFDDPRCARRSRPGSKRTSSAASARSRPELSELAHRTRHRTWSDRPSRAGLPEPSRRHARRDDQGDRSRREGRGDACQLPPQAGRSRRDEHRPGCARGGRSLPGGTHEEGGVRGCPRFDGPGARRGERPRLLRVRPALDGAFPPGSTFKAVTSTALIERGLLPSSPTSCPGSITAGGEVFHNAEGDAPVQNLAQAFTESCNTAFISLATTHLDDASLPAAAGLVRHRRDPGDGTGGVRGRRADPG